MKKWMALTVVATALMVSSSYFGIDVGWGRGAFKLTASTGFILTALAGGAMQTRYGRVVLVGLFFSWWGDAFLIGGGDIWFQLGLVSFLTGHVAYCAAFGVHGLSLRWIALAILPVVAMAGVIMQWLMPYVPAEMKIPVWAYTIVITSMVVLAFGTQGKGGSRAIPIGALLFYFSDISVSSGKFAPGDFPHYVWGLPFYFVGQLFLAYSVYPVAQRLAPGKREPSVNH